MKLVIPVCVVLATIPVFLSLLTVEKSEVRACISFDADAKQWHVKGEVRFSRGRVHVMGWLTELAARTVAFELLIPDQRGVLTQDMYEPKAIQAAEAQPVPWEWNYIGVVLGWLATFFGCLVIWWLYRSVRSSHQQLT